MFVTGFIKHDRTDIRRQAMPGGALAPVQPSRDSACMATLDTIETGPSVIEHDGMLWKPRRGATSSADEFIAARAAFVEINSAARWNPWVADDRSEEHDRAVEVMGQWTRAEPGHRTMTLRQWEAQQARRERDRAKVQAAQDRRRQLASKRYDPDRSHARLAMIERRSRLEYETEELARFQDGTRFPAMPTERRTAEIATLTEKVEGLTAHVARLSTEVGDPEDVVDEHGWLPRDRRELMLLHFKYERERQVRTLRVSRVELEGSLKAAIERSERSRLRTEIATANRELGELLAVPPLEPDDMCSECPTPMGKHGWVTPPYKAPCPAWPGWAARMREAREMLERFSQRPTPPAVTTPKPEPLAIVPSGLSIAEIMARLAVIQEKYPTAEVRRGRANRWEVWAGD